MKSKNLIIIALVVLAGVAVALLLLSGDKPSATAPESTQTGTASTPDQAPAPAQTGNPGNVDASQTDGGTSKTAGASPAARPGDAARELIARLRSGEISATPGELYADAQQYLRENLIADAHLLLFFLARDGHTPSAVALAEMYDPLHFDPRRSLMGEPDASQALKWYQVAARNRNALAQSRLKAMRTWVEEQARNGDETATSLLLSWPDEED